MYQSIPAVPIHPRAFATFPNPEGGAIVEIFQPGGGDFDVFHHGDWRTITLLAVVSELRRNHCEQTNDFLSSMREDHVMGSR
jgi:hypothetical protein